MDKSEKLSYARYLIQEICDKFLLEGEPYIITEGFEHIRDIMTLFAKQTNLLESALLLIENNHAEEAYILVRSILNNSMLIHYLCNDEDKRRHKEFVMQPNKSHLAFLYNIKRAAKNNWIPKPPNLNGKIREYENLLLNQGFINQYGNADKSLLRISDLAKQDKVLFGLYSLFYREGSQFEHSDISSLDIYRQQLLEEYDNKYVFKMTLSRTDIELETKVLDQAISFYSLTFIKLLQYFNNKYEHLIREEYKEDLAKLLLFIQSSSIYPSLYKVSN
jgi:hypothetical protein